MVETCQHEINRDVAHDEEVVHVGVLKRKPRAL